MLIRYTFHLMDLLVNFLIYNQIVFHWHFSLTNYFAALAIYGKDMGHSKHDQLLILV